MDVRVGLWRKLRAEELMPLNCGAGEDSWESFGLQDQTSQSQRKSTLNIHWEDWCWSWSSSTLATWCEKPTHWKKILTLGKIEGRRRSGWQRMRWHHWDVINWHEFKANPGRYRLEAWRAAVYGVAKSQTQLNDWTATCDLGKVHFSEFCFPCLQNGDKIRVLSSLDCWEDQLMTHSALLCLAHGKH